MRQILSAAFILAVGLAAPLEAKTWTCTFTAQGKGGAVPPRVTIRHDTSSGAVTVNDGFIQNYVGSPVAGDLRSSNSTRLLYSWRLPSHESGNGHWVPGMVFTVNILRASGEASISVKPQGNYERQRGNGACR